MISRSRTEQVWKETGIPGIQSSTTWAGAQGDGSYLARLKAGARFPRHTHDGWEQVLILSGSVQFNEVVLRSGDFLQAEGDDEHEALAIEDSLMFVAHHGGIRMTADT